MILISLFQGIMRPEEAEAALSPIARVSAPILTDEGDGRGSYQGAISANGAWVAFSSGSPYLVHGDTNVREDLFLRYMPTGTTWRISRGPGGIQANESSNRPAISADGRFVAYVSWASNLVTGDGNGQPDVFVYDRVTNANEIVSISSLGAQQNAETFARPAISADGRYVAFESLASNLVEGDSNGIADAFVHDRFTGETSIVSVGTNGGQAFGNVNRQPLSVSMSGDGRFVSFTSDSPNLVPGDANGKTDVFVRDLTARVTTRASIDPLGNEGNGQSWGGSLSYDGSLIAFASEATNLVEADTNNAIDIFVRNREIGGVRRVSVDSQGRQGSIHGSRDPVISADGLHVAFSSNDPTLVAGDLSSSREDVFVHDLSGGVTARVSVNSCGEEANGWNGSNTPSISGDGQRVVFETDATNLGEHDLNARGDVYMFDRRVPLSCSVHPAPAEQIQYVGLGDSYSAGEGVEPYFPDSDNGVNYCHRSERAYSQLIRTPYSAEPLAARARAGTGVRSTFIACSGAVTRNIVFDGVGQYDEPAQLARGFVNAETDLVTLTIGGNDAGFANILKICTFYSCANPAFVPMDGVTPFVEWLPGYVEGIRGDVENAYREIRTMAPEAAVVAMDYPNVFPDTPEEQNCVKLVMFNPDEQRLLREAGAQLNALLAESATVAGVHFVDVAGAYENHEICGDGGEWIMAATAPEVVFGNGYSPEPKIVGPGSFHPNEIGQAAYARAVDDFFANSVADPAAELLPGGLPANPDPMGAPTPSFRTARSSMKTTAMQATDDEVEGSVGAVELAPTDPATAACPNYYYQPGQSIQVTGRGFVGSSDVRLELMSTEADGPVLSVDGVAGPGGRFQTDLTLPASLPLGSTAAVALRGNAPGGGTRFLIESGGILPAKACDVDPPQIAMSSPAEGAEYEAGENVTVQFSCSDALNEIETCVGSSPSGSSLDTTTVGTHTFRVKAVDAAGNKTTIARRYTVGYGFEGFGGPVSAQPVLNKAPAGSTIPIMWRVVDATGKGIDDPNVFQGISATSIPCDPSVTIDPVEWLSDYSGLQYLGNGHWRFSWRTSKALAGSCVRLTLQLADGITAGRQADFIFR